MELISSAANSTSLAAPTGPTGLLLEVWIAQDPEGVQYMERGQRSQVVNGEKTCNGESRMEKRELQMKRSAGGGVQMQVVKPW